jgi:hypothetical protein
VALFEEEKKLAREGLAAAKDARDTALLNLSVMRELLSEIKGLRYDLRCIVRGESLD